MRRVSPAVASFDAKSVSGVRKALHWQTSTLVAERGRQLVLPDNPARLPPLETAVGAYVFKMSSGDGKALGRPEQRNSFTNRLAAMRRDYHNWYSHRLGRRMELLAYGHGGTPVLVFPTSRGRFFEYENHGMIHALAPKIEAGHLRVFCVDSVDAESWYNRGVHPHERVARHIAYESYILFEVLPLIRGLNGAGQVCASGCSFGGYHALNLALRHPEVASGCISLSGAFDMKPFMDGYYDQEFYFNNPVDYVPNVNDSWFLDRYRHMKLILAAGDHDICLGENFRMAGILGSKQIPHWLDIWTGGQRHDWPLWQRMAQKFF